ncbi:hypothetical protein HN587_02105 [Candidatus Woesearchaeota archaeon]|jgi:hypothetical protein|nr:hypothetical protein [Candidatus Woesearchaeota archaeon]
MQQTLKQKIEAIDIVDWTAHDAARKKCIDDFLASDPLANLVREGKDTYHAAAQFVLNQYAGFFSRFFRPNDDPKFDANVVALINSINSMGVQEEINPKIYTTEGYNERFIDQAVDCVWILGGIGGVAGYFFHSLAAGISTIVGTSVLAGAAKAKRANTFLDNLKELEDAAMRADSYLTSLTEYL